MKGRVFELGAKIGSAVAFYATGYAIPQPYADSALELPSVGDAGARAAAAAALVATWRRSAETAAAGGEPAAPAAESGVGVGKSSAEAFAASLKPVRVRVRHRQVECLARLDSDDHPKGASDGDEASSREARASPLLCRVQVLGRNGREAAPVVLLLSSEDELLSPEGRAALKPSAGAGLTYKWNGENWLVRGPSLQQQHPVARAQAPGCPPVPVPVPAASAAGAVAPGVPFDLYRRCDCKPKALLWQLRNNIMNLPPPACARGDDEAPLDVARAACAACGPLSGDALAAHITHDAAVAARSGAYRRLLHAYLPAGAPPPRLAALSATEAGARAVPFLLAPFTSGPFWFRSVAKGAGGRRGGKRGKKRGKKGKQGASSAPATAGDAVRVAQADQVWGYLRRSAFDADGKVVLRVGRADFEAPDVPLWEPCHPSPDPVTLHWPGYRLMARVSTRPGRCRRAAGVHSWQDAMRRARELAEDAAGGKVGQGDEVWRAAVLVVRGRLPPRSNLRKWRAVLSNRAAVWTEAGEVPATWQPVRECDPGAATDVNNADGDGSGGGATLVGFMVPIAEARRFHLTTEMPAHSFSAVQAVAAAAPAYASWLGQLGQRVWDVECAAGAYGRVWEHSFELIGSNYQGNPEGLPTGVNAFVPHRWHPAGAAWLAPVSGSEAPQSYFGFRSMFQADPDESVVREGIVVDVGAAVVEASAPGAGAGTGEGGADGGATESKGADSEGSVCDSSKDDDVEAASRAGGVCMKVRREDFGMAPAKDGPKGGCLVFPESTDAH